MNAPQIKITSVHYRYARKPFVFEDFSLRITPGITLLKGFSGCGKSTLLRLIAGYLRPQSGLIKVPPSSGSPDRNFQRKHLGFVFQDINLFPDADLRRNIDLATALSGANPDAHRDRYQQWMHRLGLLPIEHSKSHNLSGGQRQRAAFARAVVKDPIVLCLDEPTSGLDDLNTSVIKECLCEFSRETRFCIIATHDERLQAIADHTVDFNQFLPVEPHLLHIGK